MFRFTISLLALLVSAQACGTGNAITGFTLIDADVDAEIGPMPAVIDYATLPTTNLNVRADFYSCPKDPIDSVFMDYKGPGASYKFCERWTPFSVFGDDNPGGPDLGPIGPFNNYTFPIGPNQTIVATPNTGMTCNEIQGIPGVAKFNVVNTVKCPGKVLSFVFWDATAMKPLFEIKDQMRICAFNVTNYNIEARVVPCVGGKIGSVSFSYNNFKKTMNVSQTEKRDHYFLFGDFKGQVFGSGAPLPNGRRFTLAATPFTAKGGNGPAGESKSVNLQPALSIRSRHE